ncbi:hypothetical protein GIB67_021885 [Kingdonia uniflora]|uniref:Uncharacterized protein n=1 Tax=Kingdonia uniflora TaxID=39325 RepID=A0A7J7NEK9_9MAGN|nr:hypothetical protein GIB67_021885 [Kingdonia uniflora]
MNSLVRMSYSHKMKLFKQFTIIKKRFQVPQIIVGIFSCPLYPKFKVIHYMLDFPSIPALLF